jgi:pimeloyl-ACP methyl ester carboxylesterase
MDIAYQVFGDGPVDLLMLPGPLISLDSIDAEPGLYRFHRRLASFARVIRFDQRGMGMSSRVPHDIIEPEFWAEDALVSSTVREIVTGSRRRFTERAEHDLKGVPGRWRVHALVREAATVGR